LPRAGLTGPDVVRAGADLADEVGFANLAMAPLAERLGVRTPSLYKHIESVADLQHRIATLAIDELSDAVGAAMQGRSGTDALVALARAYRTYITAHPGRYAATVGAEFSAPDDPLYESSARIVDATAAVLRGYDIDEKQMSHAMRTIRCALHGFATLQSNNAFQWTGDPEESFDWMIRFIDHGLRTLPS
jgi:AcrR family transcriptional regulator